MMDHHVTNLELFAFLPGHKTLYLYSAFVQDEIMLVEERLRLTLGSKIEHNSYTGFEVQPNVRLTWMPAKTQTIWAAVSRAVRTPARIDRDFYLFLIPNLPLIAGSDSFRSENVIAYEMGWRLRPVNALSISLSAFYNVYDDIRSAEPGPPPYGIPITFGNGVKGNTYGFELSTTYQATGWWNLRGGYTFLKKDLSVKPGSKDMNKGTAESDDPEHQFLIQSSMDLPGRIELGWVLRYVSKLPNPYVPGYTGLDVRIGWKLTRALELDLVGQDLLDSPHPEFLPTSPSPREMQHSIYGKIICRL
jgi:iron complex outermembrane receptor protein